MIHHFSLSAREPERVARTIAALWRGEAYPFPPVAKGSWVAIAGDDRGSTIEVYPAGTELHPTPGDEEAAAIDNPGAARFVASHAAVASPLEREEVYALAAREGWTAKYRKRGGVFGVIEFWLEDSFLIEVLTPEMQREYTDFMSPGAWRAMLAAGRPDAGRPSAAN